MKKYDPILCMMVEDEVVKTNDSSFQKGKKYWSDRFHRYIYFVEIDGSGRYIFEDIAGAKLAFGANEVSGIKVRDEQKVIKSKNGYTLGINNGKLVLAFTYKGETLNNPHMWLGEANNESNYNKAMQMFEEFAKIKHNDASSVKDSSRGHEIIVKTENYLSSLGKNNSTGRYDNVVRGVKSLLEQGFLQGPELERAIKQEADRLLKKYNPNDALNKAIKNCDTGESITYEGYIIVNQGSYWFIKGISNMKFPSDKEAIEWLKENK